MHGLSLTVPLKLDKTLSKEITSLETEVSDSTRGASRKVLFSSRTVSTDRRTGYRQEHTHTRAKLPTRDLLSTFAQ